ncbi:MAG: threonine/serine dehydratase [Acidobacteria bacterium]|nr:MAG: threonine/serine dehydratase [Acidobacteriota bacterium]
MSSPTKRDDSVTLEDVRAAYARVAPEIIRTPLVLSDAATDLAGVPVYLKLENLQRTGAFKIRGALSKVTSFTPEERQHGIICASTGNHGLAVAYASARFGARCVVVLPDNASPHKVALVRKLGAEIITDGRASDARQQKVDQFTQERGYKQVHPFSDPVLIAGQGTVGLEILEDLPEADEVYVPIGGGGLISGIAVAIKEQKPSVRIYGVEPENSNAMFEALRYSEPVPLPRVDTIADGLAARITEGLNYSIVSHYVDEVILVSDREILEATFFLLEHARLLVEPSAAASFVGLLSNPKRRGKAVAVISGGNVTLQQIQKFQKAQEI